MTALLLDAPSPCTAHEFSCPDHRGKPQAENRVFFREALAEIGQVISAHSSLRRGKNGLGLAARTGVVFLSCLPAVAVAFYRNTNIIAPGPDAWIPWASLSAVLLIISLPIALLATHFCVRCSFVGLRGAVLYESCGRVGSAVREQRILFDDAAALFCVSRSICKGTTTTLYKWTDYQGKIVRSMKHAYTGTLGMSQDNLYHFFRAVEASWTQFAFERALAQIERDGHLLFRVTRELCIVLGPGFIDFQVNGTSNRCEAKDIKSMSISNGRFHLAHCDAKWYGMKGKFSFNYDDMPNAKMFHLALARLLPNAASNAIDPHAEPTRQIGGDVILNYVAGRL